MKKLCRITYQFAIFCLFLSANKAWALKGNYINNSEVPAAGCLIVYDLPADKMMICSGTLATTKSGKKQTNKVLTAAHCVKGSEEEKFISAKITCGGQERSLVNQIANPLYKADPFVNPEDFGVITASEAFDGEPLLITKNESEEKALIEKRNCIGFGYGQDNDEKTGILHAVKNPFYYQDDGKVATYLNMYMMKNNFIYGDSGAGVLCKDDDNRYKIVSVVSGGVVSFGITNFPMVHRQYKWIKKQLGESFLGL